MVSIKGFKTIALSFPETIEATHFEKTSFKIKTKIFVTLSENENLISVKLSPVDQSAFCTFDAQVIFPVPNKWGKQGWTLIDLKKVKKEMLIDALTTAYCLVAPKSLSKIYTDLRDKM